jgi:DNA-binding NtrC family response regulator
MSEKNSILIVDDDLSILEVLEARLTAAGFNVLKVNNGPDAVTILQQQKVDLLVSDIKMPEMSGLQLQKKVRAILPDLPVILLTAYGTIPDAVEAVKTGAVDYLTKPFDGKELVQKIKTALLRPAGPVARVIAGDDRFVWGDSRAMKELKGICDKVADSSANVLILGESGVGKEGIARLLHDNSSRAGKPYVVVDCGTTPAGILESELFGHLKGSFTNAIQDKKGLIEASDGGTLFLDEVGNISAEMQSRLLRFLEEGTIRQVGAIKEKKMNSRVIAATNADLKAAVEKGEFRQDLYYRLRVVTLKVPPLRERVDDIAPLAAHLIKNYCAVNALPEPELPEETIAWMKGYNWPGNVRELKNNLETGILLCKNNRILPEDFQLDSEVFAGVAVNGENNFSIEQSEKEAIIRALKQTNGVKKEAAELLGISRRAIQYKSKKYNIDATKYKN